MSPIKPVVSVTVAVLATFVLLTPVFAQPAQTNAGSQFRTPWGDPDLSGTWTNTTATVLERPSALADIELLTDEQRAAITAEAARYVDEFQSDHVGWYFDVGNIVNYGWPEQWVRILGHRILKLDFKEFSRKKRDGEGLWKGFQVHLMEGDCDWPEVMKALDEIGYTKGWGSAEVKGGNRERLQFISDRMDKIFAL